MTSTLSMPGHLACICFWAEVRLDPKVEWKFPGENCSMCMLQLLKGSVKWGLNGCLECHVWDFTGLDKQLMFIQWVCVRASFINRDFPEGTSTLVISLHRYNSKLESPFKCFHCEGKRLQYPVLSAWPVPVWCCTDTEVAAVTRAAGF